MKKLDDTEYVAEKNSNSSDEIDVELPTFADSIIDTATASKDVISDQKNSTEFFVFKGISPELIAISNSITNCSQSSTDVTYKSQETQEEINETENTKGQKRIDSTNEKDIFDDKNSVSDLPTVIPEPQEVGFTHILIL